MTPLKILMTNDHTSIKTGSAVQLYLLARELKKRGHHVSVMFKSRKPEDLSLHPTLARFTELGIEVVVIPFAKLKHTYTIPALIELGAFLRTERFHVIHTFAGMDLDYFYLLAFFGTPGVIVANRGMYVPLDFFNSFKYRSRRVARLVVVAEAIKEITMQSGRVPADKIEVSYSAFDLDAYDLAIDGKEVRKDLGLPRDAPVIGAVGAFRFAPGHRKGGMELLAAAREVVAARPDVRFLMAGDVNEDNFQREAGPLGLADKFTLLGFRNDVPRIMAACDFTVLPSTFAEGLAGVLRESLAMKRPAVATDVGGNNEVIVDGKTGFLVPPSDPPALAQAMLKLLADPALTRTMGEAGRTLVEDLCGLPKRVERIEALYREVIAQAPPPPDNFLQRAMDRRSAKLAARPYRHLRRHPGEGD